MANHTEQVIARFDDWSATYGQDRIGSWLEFYRSLAMSKLNLTEAGSFLDVGCGTGGAVRKAAKQLKSGKACGIDISPKMIEKAMAQTGEMQNIEFRVASSEAIPFPDDSFTSILCTFSFHHYGNPVQALYEMKRVVKKGGKLVILDSARDVSFAIWLQDRWRRYLERGHVRYYTTSEIRALIAQTQWELAADIVTIKKFLDHKKTFTGLMLCELVK